MPDPTPPSGFRFDWTINPATVFLALGLVWTGGISAAGARADHEAVIALAGQVRSQSIDVSDLKTQVALINQRSEGMTESLKRIEGQFVDLGRR